MRALCGAVVLSISSQALAQAPAAPEPSEPAQVGATISEPAAPNEAPNPATAAGTPPAAPVTTPATPPCTPVAAADNEQELKRIVKQAVLEHEAEQARSKREKTIRNHDGGYVRMGVNLGYVSDTARRGQAKAESSGFGGFLDLALGVSVTDALVFGIAVHSLGAFSATTELDGQELESRHSNYVQVLGVLLDYYPNPRQGLHLGVTFGSGGADIVVDSKQAASDGVGLALRLGYDVWIGEQWSLGPALGLLFVAGASDEFGNHRAVAPTLTLSALYH
jgi:hypothetical protein